MNLKDFWYIAAKSRDLKVGKPEATQILGEWIALFRDENGKAIAVQDRCIHRCAQLSRGTVNGGRLQCPYHGWTYDGEGKVVNVPSEGPDARSSSKTSRKAKRYETLEQDDYVYVCLAELRDHSILPFQIPQYKRPGWGSIRLINRFENNVTNCAENFVDIPHTVSVHPGIFRKTKNEHFSAKVSRKDGSVHVTYRNEKANLGYFSWFLKPTGAEITHTDIFHMPNVTTVRYEAGPHRIFNITSQSVPVTDEETLVFTDLTYDYGIWTKLAGPIVRNQAQKIIDQDIEILANQMKTIRKYGSKFMNTEADVIHVMIESIRGELEAGRDPRLLPDKNHDIEFWV